MYGLFLRALQNYVSATYDAAVWTQILQRAGIKAEGFEPLLAYEREVFCRVIQGAARQLSRDADDLLEDMGSFIVANPEATALRRLLRFGGANFEGFLLSLEELPERARLALPDIDMPRLVLSGEEAGEFVLTCYGDLPEMAHVLVGVLRAMADDYGALVIIEIHPRATPRDDVSLSISLLGPEFLPAPPMKADLGGKRWL